MKKWDQQQFFFKLKWTISLNLETLLKSWTPNPTTFRLAGTLELARGGDKLSGVVLFPRHFKKFPFLKKQFCGLIGSWRLAKSSRMCPSHTAFSSFFDKISLFDNYRKQRFDFVLKLVVYSNIEWRSICTKTSSQVVGIGALHGPAIERLR